MSKREVVLGRASRGIATGELYMKRRPTITRSDCPEIYGSMGDLVWRPDQPSKRKARVRK